MSELDIERVELENGSYMREFSHQSASDLEIALQDEFPDIKVAATMGILDGGIFTLRNFGGLDETDGVDLSRVNGYETFWFKIRIDDAQSKEVLSQILQEYLGGYFTLKNFGEREGHQIFTSFSPSYRIREKQYHIGYLEKDMESFRRTKEEGIDLKLMDLLSSQCLDYWVQSRDILAPSEVEVYRKLVALLIEEGVCDSRGIFEEINSWEHLADEVQRA